MTQLPRLGRASHPVVVTDSCGILRLLLPYELTDSDLRSAMSIAETLSEVPPEKQMSGHGSFYFSVQESQWVADRVRSRVWGAVEIACPGRTLFVIPGPFKIHVRAAARSIVCVTERLEEGKTLKSYEPVDGVFRILQEGFIMHPEAGRVRRVHIATDLDDFPGLQSALRYEAPDKGAVEYSVDLPEKEGLTSHRWRDVGCLDGYHAPEERLSWLRSKGFLRDRCEWMTFYRRDGVRVHAFAQRKFKEDYPPTVLVITDSSTYSETEYSIAPMRGDEVAPLSFSEQQANREIAEILAAGTERTE